ncbi:MAG: hypothetical protein MJZ76_03260, partial [Bacteroidales bacterium]|nr:hypothetical protein [Bacteroidales bacterium]
MSKERHLCRCDSAFLKIGSRSLKIEDSRASPAQTSRFFTLRETSIFHEKTPSRRLVNRKRLDKGVGEFILSVKNAVAVV